MTEEIPAAPTMPACNGSAAPEHGPLQALAGIDEIAKSVGTVPYANAETSPDTSPEKENLEENRNSLAEDITAGNFAGEKRCQEKREENDGTLQQGPADIQDTGSNGQGSGEGPDTAGPDTAGPDTAGSTGLDTAGPDTAGSTGLDTAGLDTAGSTGPDTAGPDTAGPDTVTTPDTEAAQTPAGSADPRGNAAGEEEEEEAEEEDTEEDEVQVIEIKKENSEASRLQLRDSDKQPPPPASPGCNSPLEKRGEQPGLGKKNDISRHSYSRYNTISYRRIRKGNTKQRIDEFESMMHL